MTGAGPALSGWRFAELLASDGAGRLYAGRQEGLDREVLLRVLADDAREHEVAHPHLLAVLDRGIDDRKRVLVLESPVGETLRERLARGPLEAHEAGLVLDAVLQALDALHHAQVVHGDVRPERIHLGRGGSVKLDAGGLPPLRPEDDAQVDIRACGRLWCEMLGGSTHDAHAQAVVARALAVEESARFPDVRSMADALRAAVHGAEESAGGDVRPPVDFEMRLDLLCTILSVTGMLLAVAGAALLFAERGFRLSVFVLEPGAAGIVVLVYGVLLWNSAERARQYALGARTTLLALSLLAAPTVVGLPLAIWTWTVLLSRRVRVYMDARLRGLDAAEAAALAQGLAVPEREHSAVRERWFGAARANRRLGGVCFALSLGCATALFLVGTSDTPEHRPALVILLAHLVALFGLLALGLAHLGRRVEEGRRLRLNARLWTLLLPFHPKAARRARMLWRDARDGLLPPRLR